jgi:hypothetical protein
LYLLFLKLKNITLVKLKSIRLAQANLLFYTLLLRVIQRLKFCRNDICYCTLLRFLTEIPILTGSVPKTFGHRLFILEKGFINHNLFKKVK